MKVYIRSQDLSLGFLNDLFFFIGIAEQCGIKTIKLFYGNLYVYSNNLEWSIKTFSEGKREKLPVFNVRKSN